ncbi:MAG: hypothetical protein JXA90_17035, partial [Planctomycetes bacterium]|nr:hypothetical protein [Planctomycetota bacterium]
TRVPLVLSAILLAASGARATEGRSFVGRKLSGITFVDTEGHTIDPEHYRGAVLVMIGGIPW